MVRFLLGIHADCRLESYTKVVAYAGARSLPSRSPRLRSRV